MSPAAGAAAPAGWRRVLPSSRQMLWGTLAAFVLLVVVVGIAYATTSVPAPNSFATQQTTYVYYSDGKTVLARLGQTNRTDVPLTKVPSHVQHAVLAAEDRQFYSEPGISPTGILRAMWTDVRGGDVSQGGSTITQQYAKNAYLTQQRTFTRKFKEIFIAVKLGNSTSKQEILQNYLNTIYFGRGAYGIEAASKAYFDEDVSKLTVAQGALLAAIINAPSYYDPDVNPGPSKDRWHYVLDGMVKKGWLSRADADKLTFPKPVAAHKQAASQCTGPAYFVCQAVKTELAQHNFDEQRLQLGGYRVISTLDKKAQDAAIAAIKQQHGGYVKSGSDAGREAALVTVQPGDGAIRAMYGGDGPGAKGCGTHRDDCTDLSGVSSSYGRPPGSSFKPYTVIAALKSGVSLDSRYAGPPHIDFPGTNGTGINNSEGESCPSCTLTQALAESVNTIFVPLAQQVGPDKVVDAAHTAGIPKSVKLADVPVITLGPDDVKPVDQANAYATIAAQGMRATPYLVAKVLTSDGKTTVYHAAHATTRVFDKDVMADTTYAMTKVLDCSFRGTGCGRALDGRPAAGKTGTNGGKGGDYDAWFVGFTPQLSTAVWYGNSNRKKPVTDNGQTLYGAGLPAEAWQQMMNAALAGQPVESFPPPAHVGQDKGQITATPTSAPATSSAPATTAPPTTAPPVTAPPTTAPPVTGPPTILPSSRPPSSPAAGGSSPSAGTGGGAAHPAATTSPTPAAQDGSR